MNIKKPCVIDTAYGNEGSNWSLLPLDIIDGWYYKATEGENTVDSMFAYTHNFVHSHNIPAAPYHFYRESWWGLPRDPVKNAQKFASVVNSNGGLKKGDRIVLDLEDDAGMTMLKIMACIRELRRQFNQWPILYTGYYYIKDHMSGFENLTEADIADLKQCPLIISWYPFQPDQYSSLSSTYIPNQEIWGLVIGWQYSQNGPSLPGVKGSMDYNMFDQTFMEQWKAGYVSDPGPVEPPEPPTPPTGDDAFTLEHHIATNYFGASVPYHVARFDLRRFEIVMDPRFYWATTSRWAEVMGTDYAVNGFTGWYPEINKKRRPTGRSISDGLTWFHGSGQGRPGWLNVFIDKNNMFSLTRPTSIWNAYGFPNLLINGGVLAAYDRHPLDDLRARIIWGVDKNCRWLFLVNVDGKDYWEKVGLGFQDSAQIMWDLGCWLSGMGDGGGSTTAIYRNRSTGLFEVIGTPWGEEPTVVNRGTSAEVTVKERIVPFHFGLRRVK